MTSIYLDNYPYSKYFKCYHVIEIDSTNTFLKATHILFQDHSILIADNQTNGRGRFDRVWKSDNDICFSIVFKKHYINQIIAPLALELAFIRLGFVPAIKWPNDIYFNEKKLSGILIEDIYEDKFQASIIGIGINMTSKNEFNSIGINDIKKLSKEIIISTILEEYEKLIHLDDNTIINEYIKYSMVINRTIIYHDKEYKALGITKDGHLILDNNGIKKEVQCDEITFKEAIIK